MRKNSSSVNPHALFVVSPREEEEITKRKRLENLRQQELATENRLNAALAGDDGNAVTKRQKASMLMVWGRQSDATLAWLAEGRRGKKREKSVPGARLNK